MSLFVGLFVVLVFAFGVIPWLQTFPPISDMCDVIRKNNIEATALVYTEVESFSEAEFSIRNSLKYPARRATIDNTKDNRLRTFTR